jgi:hypothetical protein
MKQKINVEKSTGSVFRIKKHIEKSHETVPLQG